MCIAICESKCAAAAAARSTKSNGNSIDVPFGFIWFFKVLEEYFILYLIQWYGLAGHGMAWMHVIVKCKHRARSGQQIIHFPFQPVWQNMHRIYDWCSSIFYELLLNLSTFIFYSSVDFVVFHIVCCPTAHKLFLASFTFSLKGSSRALHFSQCK